MGRLPPAPIGGARLFADSDNLSYAFGAGLNDAPGDAAPYKLGQDTYHAADGRTFRLKSQSACFRSRIVKVSPDALDIQIIPVRCGSWDCEYCGPYKRGLLISKLLRCKPQRAITITCSSLDFDTALQQTDVMKDAWQKLVKRIRRRFGPFEYILIWELHTSGRPHAHALMRGCYLPLKWLRKNWQDLTRSWNIEIRKIGNTQQDVAHLAKYLGKGQATTSKVLKGRRLIQASKHWYAPLKESPPTPAPPGTSYIFSSHTLRNICDRYTTSPRLRSFEERWDGSISIRMHAPEYPCMDPSIEAAIMAGMSRDDPDPDHYIRWIRPPGTSQSNATPIAILNQDPKPRQIQIFDHHRRLLG